MEDDLKTLKAEYLRNHLLDRNQILNLSLDDQTIFLQIFKWKTTLSINSIPQQPLIGSYLNI